MGVVFLPPLLHRCTQAFFATAIPHDQLRPSWSHPMGRAAGSDGHCCPSATHSALLVHEMIHGWVDLVLHQREGHGPCLCAKMEEINGQGMDLAISMEA